MDQLPMDFNSNCEESPMYFEQLGHLDQLIEVMLCSFCMFKPILSVFMYAASMLGSTAFPFETLCYQMSDQLLFINFVIT